jgi:hypothetical protein
LPGALAPAQATTANIDPYSTPATTDITSSSGGDPQIHRLSGILGKNAGWIKFQGILMMVLGILYCLTIIYAIIGWVPIWMGRLLMQASEAIKKAEETGQEPEFALSQEKLALYFKITGIMMLISLILGVLAVVAGIVVAIIGATAGSIEPAG